MLRYRTQASWINEIRSWQPYYKCGCPRTIELSLPHCFCLHSTHSSSHCVRTSFMDVSSFYEKQCRKLVKVCHVLMCSLSCWCTDCKHETNSLQLLKKQGIACMCLQVWTPIWDSAAYSEYRDEHCNVCNDTAVCKHSTEIWVGYKTSKFCWSLNVFACFLLLINQNWTCVMINTDVCMWKRCQSTFAFNFAKCWLIFKIVSLADLVYISGKTIIKYPTTSQTHHYTTLCLLLRSKCRYIQLFSHHKYFGLH